MNHTILRNVIFIIIIGSSSCLYALQEIDNQRKLSSERAENAKFVLAHIAQMIGQIGSIVEEPRNADNVNNAITNIVSNIVKITMHAVQNKSISTQEAQNILYILRQECDRFDRGSLRIIPKKIMDY